MPPLPLTKLLLQPMPLLWMPLLLSKQCRLTRWLLPLMRLLLLQRMLPLLRPTLLLLRPTLLLPLRMLRLPSKAGLGSGFPRMELERPPEMAAFLLRMHT